MSTKRKAPGKIAAPVVKSSARPSTRKTTINESRTTVSAPDVVAAETIDISSDPESSDYDEMDEDTEAPAAAHQAKANGSKHPATQAEPAAPLAAADEAGSDAEDAEEGTSPSFGELLRGSNATIDVPALMTQTSNPSSLLPARSQIAPPTHASLTTVLTQALKTDDATLLESCLHTTDPATIQNTIERIDSALAGTLLLKLASRLHVRPGRAGKLMTWVQWTLIAHGGALATQPKVVKSLGGLQQVLSERAKGLNSLLALKGKLDLLEGQMDLRRRMQKHAGASRRGEDDEDEDADVIYVEGEDKATSSGLTNGFDSREADEDDEDEPTMNGLAGDSDEDDSDLEEDEDSDIGENEAEVEEEEEVDHDDLDDSMGEEEDSDAEPAPPAKKRK